MSAATESLVERLKTDRRLLGRLLRQYVDDVYSDEAGPPADRLTNEQIEHIAEWAIRHGYAS